MEIRTDRQRGPEPGPARHSIRLLRRFYQFTAAALGSGLPRDALLAFGVASLLLAALYVFGQRDIKRLLAYSSAEHMGILAIGVSFGAPVALAGVMLHVLAHAAAKGNAFMGAGVFTVKFGSKQISALRGGLDLLPWSGPLFLLAVFALAAMPPSASGSGHARARSGCGLRAAAHRHPGSRAGTVAADAVVDHRDRDQHHGGQQPQQQHGSLQA